MPFFTDFFSAILRFNKKICKMPLVYSDFYKNGIQFLVYIFKKKTIFDCNFYKMPSADSIFKNRRLELLFFEEFKPIVFSFDKESYKSNVSC